MNGKKKLAAKFGHCTPSAASRYDVIIVRSGKNGVSVIKGKSIQTFVDDVNKNIAHFKLRNRKIL
jgi:hypothetical protein